MLRMRKGWPAAAWGLLLILLVVAGVRLMPVAVDYRHPDEIIPVAVARTMIENRTPDTNWEHAPLPDEFKYPQYNFSGYIMSAAAVLQVREWLRPWADADALHWLRAWSALLGLAAIALTFALGRAFFDDATGLVAAAAVAVNPLLFQDGLYARPETFVTVLTLIAVGLAASPPPVSQPRAFTAAFVLGLLVATKVSMLLLLPLLLLTLDSAPDRTQDRQAGRSGGFGYAWARAYPLPAGVLLGFVVGAPYGLVHLADFVDGVQALRKQYGSGHWPHGLPEASFLERMGYAGRYFRTTTGGLVAVAFAGAAVAAVRRQWRPFAVFLLAVLTALQFATFQVFFERNLSHVVPVFALFAAYAITAGARALSRRRWQQALICALLALAVLWPSWRTTRTLRFHELAGVSRTQLQALRNDLQARFKLPLLIMPWSQDYHYIRKIGGYSCGPMLIEVPSADDAISRELQQQLRVQDNFREVARLPSAFARVPPSTLHTYFQPTAVFMQRGEDPDACWRHGGGVITPGMAGERLPVTRVEADAAWTRGGGFQVEADPFGGQDYFGSWSGRDTHRGRLRLTVDVETSDFIVLPYRTGPQGLGMTVRLTDADTGQVLLVATPKKAPEWVVVALRVPVRTRSIVVEADDDGSGWGDWLAVGMPRRLR